MENWVTVFQCNHTLLHLYHDYINILISSNPQYNIFMVYLFNYSHSSMYEIISHCGSRLVFFLITNKWSYFYMCTRNYYIYFYKMCIQKLHFWDWLVHCIIFKYNFSLCILDTCHLSNICFIIIFFQILACLSLSNDIFYMHILPI